MNSDKSKSNPRQDQKKALQGSIETRYAHNFSPDEWIGNLQNGGFKDAKKPGETLAFAFTPLKPSYFLDNISTTGSLLNSSVLDGLPSNSLTAVKGHKATALTPTDYNRIHGRRWERIEVNKKQVKYLYRIAQENPEERLTALNAASALQVCGRLNISEKLSTGDFRHIARYRCGKKYCADCSNWKRGKLLRLFSNFFESTDDGKKMLEEFDLAMFTVTLRHNKELRARPYYDELRVHFRNALKYGAFKEYFAGGFYNTEHKYNSDTLHHIHRHALVLIPKIYDVKKNWEKLESELRKQWLSRTGDSFQIDLTPLGLDKKTNSFNNNSLFENLFEVTKYITDRESETGLIDYEIIKAVEKNRYYKFYNRFGVLYKNKHLKMNQDKIEDAQGLELREAELGVKDLYFTSGLYCKVKETKEGGKKKKEYVSYTYKKLEKIQYTPKLFEEFAMANIKNRNLWKYRTFFNMEDGYNYQKFKENKERAEALRLKNINRTITQLPLNFEFLTQTTYTIRK